MYSNDDSVNKITFYFITFVVFVLCIGVMLLTFSSKAKVDKRKNEIEDLNGKSSYEVAKENGFTGTLEEYLASIKGVKGSSGKSAYELAKEEGITGDIETWISLMNGIKGVDGKDGKSSYEIAKENGFDGTFEQYQLVVQKIANDDTVGESGKDGDGGLQIENVSINTKEVNGALSTTFIFTFNDGSKCRKRSFPKEKLTDIFGLRNTSFPAGLENYYFVLEAEFNGSNEQEIIVSMKDCTVSDVDFNTPGNYTMKLSYKGFQDYYNVTVSGDSQSEIYSVGVIDQQYIELLDSEDKIEDLTIEGYYNYDSRNKCTLKYGEDFYVSNPEILYKSYYDGKEAHACRAEIRVYSYSYQDGRYVKNPNSYNYYYVYFYDPSNLCVMGYSTNTCKRLIVKDKNKDEIPTENFFEELEGIKIRYSDGTYEDYTLKDEDMGINVNSGTNPIYNDSTIDKFTSYYGNLYYYYYSGNNVYKTSANICINVVYLDTLSLSDIFTSSSVSLTNYYLTSTFLDRNHNNFNNSSYELYLYYGDEKKLGLGLYEEAYVQLNNYYTLKNGNSYSFTSYEKIEDILEYVDYENIEDEIYGKSNWDNRTFTVKYPSPFTNEIISLSLNQVRMYDREGYSLNADLKRDLRCSNEMSYLDDEEISLNIYRYVYFRNSSISGHTYLEFKGTVKEAEEKFLAPGERLVRNVGGVDLSKKGDTIVYFYIPEYGIDRCWAEITENAENNNIREMELDRDVFTYPVGSSLDDIFYDNFAKRETYASIYYSADSTNSYYPRYEREWFKDNETGELNRIYNETGTYTCTIESGFCSCVCNTITICIVDTVEDDPSIKEVDKYIWDIREDLKRPPIFALDYEHLEFTLYSNGSVKMDLYYLDTDWDDEAEEGYTVELYLEGTMYFTYKMKDDKTISILFGGYEYDFIIREDNFLTYVEADMNSLTKIVTIENEEMHDGYIEIMNFYVFEEGYVYYLYDEISLSNESDPDPWWREEVPFYLFDRCEVIDEKTIYFKFSSSYMRIIDYYDEFGEIKSDITEPDIYLFG